MTRHQEIVFGALVCLLAATVVLDRVVFHRYGSTLVARLPEADRAVIKTRYRLLLRIVEALIVFIGLVAALFSFDQTKAFAQTVLASSALLGLVVGFAARSTLANFVAGVMIAVNQPVRLGDRVAVGDAEGIVEDVGLTYTRLRTPDNRRVLIPNEELANSRVTNLTVIDPVSLAQARIVVPITADAARVREVLAEQAAAAPGALADRPGPGVSVAELTAVGAVFTVGVWTADAAQAVQTAAWLRERALARLNDEGVLASLEPEPA
ncbi:MAG TPA: mechanosensitive ion channel domain-containing protein [Gaiellales bacterium]|nr:mechanosensitive ion channel domain-containing protein [Gaiellales bacterium]